MTRNTLWLNMYILNKDNCISNNKKVSLEQHKRHPRYLMQNDDNGKKTTKI